MPLMLTNAQNNTNYDQLFANENHVYAIKHAITDPVFVYAFSDNEGEKTPPPVSFFFLKKNDDVSYKFQFIRHWLR